MRKNGSDIRILGNARLLDSHPAVILNSRHGKYPKGDDPWVKNTIAAVKSAISMGRSVIASVGMNTWELALWAAGEYGGSVIIILPKTKQTEIVNNMEYFMQDFNLKLDRCALIFIDSSPGTRGKKGWWENRDNLAFDLAYEIMPVSIRDDGRWNTILNSPLIKAKKVYCGFQIKYQNATEKMKMVIEIPSSGISYNWDYITHWTRRFSGPWPGEKSADFYRAIAFGGINYPRSADATLERILSENLLRGSSSWMKNNKTAVSFTQLPPLKATELMKYRKRYVRYTFEPFGIAIKKDAARETGIKPVEYIEKTRGLSPLSSVQRLPDTNDYTQTYSKGEWWQEEEWRQTGDLDLTQFSKDDILIIVPTIDFVERFSRVSQYPVLSLDKMGQYIDPRIDISPDDNRQSIEGFR